jgi:hypothetical protein
MSVLKGHLTILFCALLLAGYSGAAGAQVLFSDDFEDRAPDQARIGNDWTWYDQSYNADVCSGTLAGQYGPWDDGDGSDYVAENRNYYTASEEYAGQGDSYFRAGLEVPAWEGSNLTNMLRVYNNQYNTRTSCKRVLIFQEMTIEEAGSFTFSFDVAQDQHGAPENGEVTAAFVKVLIQSDKSWRTVLFEKVLTTPPEATGPEDVTTTRQFIDFEIPEELVGEWLQFGFYSDVVENQGQSVWNSAALYDNVVLEHMPIGPAHSGSWYNDDQSGHGFSIEFGLHPLTGNPRATVYWYTYDDQGNPIFMVGAGKPVENVVEINFKSPVGMQFGIFDPDSVTREQGGTGVFVFSDRDNGTFSYTPSTFSGSNWGHVTPIDELPITRLFVIPADGHYVPSQVIQQ